MMFRSMRLRELPVPESRRGVQQDAVEGSAADRVADDHVVVAALDRNRMLSWVLMIVLFITMLLWLPLEEDAVGVGGDDVQESMTEFWTPWKLMP